MNQILKKIGILVFAFAAVICLGLAAACVNEEGNKDTEVSVTLVSETFENTVIQAKPGDALPVLNVEDKDFEGYWTDSSYAVKYEGTTVPDSDITLYYKLNSQYYTVIIDYGTDGSFTFGQLCRGEDEELPQISPSGTVLAGYAVEKGGKVVYAAGEPVRNLAEKNETVTLYAVCEVEDADDYVIENGVLVAYRGSATVLTLPAGADTVATGAFAENIYSAKITSLTVPDNYKKIECGAFEGLDGLQSLTVPFIGESRTKNRFLSYMFGAQKYTDNYYSFSLYSDGTNFYEGNINIDSLLIPQTLRTVYITDTVRDFAEGAFYSAYSLENVILEYPEKLMSVGDSAFENCYSFGYDSTLGVAVNPVWLSYVTTIGDSAFKSYTGDTETDVTSIDIGNGVTAELVSYETPLNTLTYIPELTNVVTIGKEAFYYCATLGNVTFGEKLKSIGDDAFMFAFTINNLRFPDSLESIGKMAFSATGVTVIEFGTGIREIGSMAFAESSSLKEIVFRGGKVPTLSGGQCFSNSVEESVTGSYNVVFDEGFRISVPEDSVANFISAPDWAEYLKYIDGATNEATDVYWSANSEDWNALFQFTAGGAVFVTDPAKIFIASVDEEGTFSQSCGSYYALLFEVISEEKYAETAGAHAKALYANEYIVHMWNPSLTDSKGNIVDLYFVVTKLPYSSGNSRVLLPVLESLENAGKTLGDSTAEGSFVISYNNYGIAQLMQVKDGAAAAVADPEGTYFSDIIKDASGLSYTISYYNNNFEVLSSRTFVSDNTKADGDKAPLTEKKADTAAVLTKETYNGGTQLFLKGDGTAYIKYTDTSVHEYTASVTVSGTAKYGEEVYAVSFADFKNTDGTAASLTGTATFRDFNGTDYARIDLKIGDFFFMIVNMQNEEEWTVLTYNELEEAPEVIIPSYSSVGDAWRYKKLSNPEVNSSVEIFINDNGTSYYREYDKNGSVISCGTAAVNEKAVTLTPYDGSAARTAQFGENSLVLDGKTFTQYNSAEDMTYVLYEESMIMKQYYYTVKTDGYGNMYILDESYGSSSRAAYLGTYVASQDETLVSMGYGRLVFTGRQINPSTGKPISGAAEETVWIIYDLTSITARTSAQDSPWYTLVIGIFGPQEDTVITVNDAFGYKAYEITVDAFGGTKYVQYSYTLDREGNVTYSVVENGNVSAFIPVFDENDAVAYCVAVGDDGQTMFSVRPEGGESDTFIMIKDGGQIVTYATANVAVDVSALGTLPEGGATFGNV